MVVMKAMGMENDQEVVQLIGRDPRYAFLLMPSVEVIDMYIWLWMR
jgi:DNA-directed RNA polymerase III subunit RPC2